jgi:hypothetical protein
MLGLVLFVAVAGCAAAGVDGPRGRVELVTGEALEARLTGFDGQAFEFETAAGPRRVPAAELALLHAATEPPPVRAVVPPPIQPPQVEAPPADDLLLLAGPDPDCLVGRLVGGDADGVLFDLGGGSPVGVAFERIERLLPAARLPVDRLALLAGAGDDDRLWRRREDGGLDSLSGVVDRVADGAVAFYGALGSLEFPLEEVVALVLAGGEAGDAGADGLPVLLRLAGGSRLSGRLLHAGAGRVLLATRFAARLELPLEAVRALVPRGADRVLLAELAPVEVEERPTVGGPDDVLFPWRRDLSVTGRQLAVDGLPRATGLGVHAFTRLAFDLPPGVRTLRVTGGLCDEVSELPAHGSVEFRVLVDGRERARAAVTEDGAPALLRVAGLDGARRLELLVSDAGDDDAGDRAAWVDGLLLRGGE